MFQLEVLVVCLLSVKLVVSDQQEDTDADDENDECKPDACDDGKEWVQKPDYKPVWNGCGSDEWVNDIINAFFDITEADEACCKEHDICYGLCNKTKVMCDDQFGDCLNKTDGNQNKAEVFKAAVESLGCDSYMSGQENNCVCGEKTIEPDETKNSSDVIQGLFETVLVTLIGFKTL